jgi:glycosyltransferase involved in cell wall biosynthesis
MLNKSYPPHLGGIERTVESLARGLASHGAQVEVLVCSENFSFSQESEENLRITRVRRFGTVRSLPLGLSTFLRVHRISPDLIHVHVPYPLGEVSTLSISKQVPVLATWHSDIIRQKALRKLYRPLQERFLKRTRFLLPTSPPMIEASPHLSRYRDKCRVVHLGIDLERFSPTPERLEQCEQLHKEWNMPTILFVGRLIEYKGLPTLINAMREIPARLEIIGEGRLMKSLKAQAKYMNLADRIHFAGALSDEDVTAHMMACSFLALPSTGMNETLGIVQLEAMACGKPVVSTNLPTGVPYANKHGLTGLVVEPGDVQALRAAFLELLSDEGLRATLGEYAQGRVQQYFSAEKMVKDTLALYHEALAGGS